MPQPSTKWEQLVTRAMGACVRTFGEGLDENGLTKILYLHAAVGSSRYYDGIYEATTEVIDLETGATVMTNQPRVSFALSDLIEAPIEGDVITIRGLQYAVVEPTFDGQGTVTLRLHRYLPTGGGGGGGGVIS